MTKIATSTNDRLFWIAASAIIVFVYFFGLSIPLLGPDEPRYAQVAREMFERGDWITPTLGGHKWFEKPALLYWFQILSYNLFGVSEFATRLGSAIFGLGTIAAMWVLGRTYLLESAESADKDAPANWFALVSASSLGLIVFSRGASFDIILTFPITAAMVGFYVFDSQVRRSRTRTGSTLPLLCFYFFVGMALLAKGLVGALFPFASVFLYFLVSRRFPGRQFLTSLGWGALVTALVAATWYLPAYSSNGWQFVDEFIIQHHFQRYTSNKYLHPQPFYFFFWVLPLMTIPWLPFFFAAIWDLCKRALSGPSGTTAGPSAVSNDAVSAVQSGNGDRHESVRQVIPAGSAALVTFAAVWLLVPLVFFSFSGSKLPGYIMPALPPAVAITAIYLLNRMRNKPRSEKWFKALAMATFVVVVAIAIFVLPRFADTDSVKGLIAAADARGHAKEIVLSLNGLSHNAEFYAPGRLLRDADGKQRRLNGTAELQAEIRRAGGGALVLTPVEHRGQLENSPLVTAEIIRDNGEYLIAYVRSQ